VSVPAPDPEVLDRVIEAMRPARRLLFITGAGVSADSGLPTYRGIGGLYEDAITEEGMAIEDALSGETFLLDPSLSWKYIHQIERACRGAAPNDAHRVIAGFEERFESVVVLTQNVDGFHRAAGSSNLIEIHGDIHQLFCTGCAYSVRVPDYSALEIPPACPECGAVLRPDVVLFGEMLPEFELMRLHAEVSRGFDVVFSVGTTSVFPYISGPVVMAARTGIPTVEINPGVTEVSDVVDHRIASGAAVTLTALRDRLV
jgi:NAD-dependent deacetylase